mmetsp:Transcript_51428/g.105687  ORF Transcript_51428/g.105687 Transcript_51428/m.105687 type:complete len:82 (+) Transcript_51428:19-264(+)
MTRRLVFCPYSSVLYSKNIFYDAPPTRGRLALVASGEPALAPWSSLFGANPSVPGSGAPFEGWSFPRVEAPSAVLNPKVSR